MSNSQGKGDAPQDEDLRDILEEDLRHVSDHEVHQTLGDQSLGDQPNDGAKGFSLSEEDARPTAGIMSGVALSLALIVAVLVVVVIVKMFA